MCSIIGYIGKEFTPQSIRPYFDRTLSRGPDMSRILPIPGGFLGFHRLAIMGLNEMGMQPFVRGDMALVCNGEIYGFRAIRKTLQEKGYIFHSDSDCEILLPLYAELGVEMFRQLDAEFAMILFDGSSPSSPPGIPSASVRCTMATMGTGRSSSPARPRIWWGCAPRSCPSRPGTTIRTANSSATGI